MKYSLLTILPIAMVLSACNQTAEEDTAAPDQRTTVVADPATPPEVDDGSDALVQGTDYNATSQIQCSDDGAAPTQVCSAGVKRKWGEDGTTLVEVTRPDGRTRAIFFRDTEAYGTDSAQADGL